LTESRQSWVATPLAERKRNDAAGTKQERRSMSAEETSKLTVFHGKPIRKAIHKEEWWFSIIDVIEVLVGGDRPRKYWNDLKKN
jgi:prophage antirepressor-like protein